VNEALAKQHKNVLIMLKALERFCFIAFIVCESPVLFTGARHFIVAGFSYCSPLVAKNIELVNLASSDNLLPDVGLRDECESLEPKRNPEGW
jgi:hypothetical protein